MLHRRRVLRDARKLARADRTIVRAADLTDSEKKYVVHEKRRAALNRMDIRLAHVNVLRNGQKTMIEAKALMDVGVGEELAMMQAANVVWDRELDDRGHAGSRDIIRRWTEKFAQKGEDYLEHDFQADIDAVRSEYADALLTAENITPEDINKHVPEYGETEQGDSSFYNAEEDFGPDLELSVDAIPESDGEDQYSDDEGDTSDAGEEHGLLGGGEN